MNYNKLFGEDMSDINPGSFDDHDKLSDEDSMLFALQMLLSTKPGERLYRGYGTDYRKYLHQLASPVVEQQIRTEGISSVHTFEPLMDTVSVETSVNLQADGQTYIVKVTVIDKATRNERATFFGQLEASTFGL